MLGGSSVEECNTSSMSPCGEATIYLRDLSVSLAALGPIRQRHMLLDTYLPFSLVATTVTVMRPSRRIGLYAEG